MKKGEKNKIFGIITTVAFHAIVVVLLFTLCFRTPLPLPGEAGVEVNLGMYNQGMGFDSRQDAISKPANPIPKVEEQQQQAEEEDILSNDEEVLSIEQEQEADNQDVEDNIVEEEIEETSQEEPIEEVVEEKPVVNRRALFQSPDSQQQSQSEGNTEEEGIQGNPNGLKDIDRYEGQGGSGGGPSYDLGGRGAKSISSPSRNFKEEGKVVVDIWVDKDGIVKRAEIGKGTTVTDVSMRESARQAAMNSVFAEDKNAAELQRGTITYTFIIRQ